MQVYVNQNIFLDDDILFPYYCDPKVEIGRFQNTAIEVNQDYIDKHSIQSGSPRYWWWRCVC